VSAAGPTDQQCVEAATQVAPEFGLAPTKVRIISRSENVVCALTLPSGDQVIMRLHRPGYNTLAEMESEVQWVQALSDAGVPVPHAIPTRAGPFYTAANVGAETRYVGVVSWVDGEPLGDATSASGVDIVNFYAHIGTVAAQIRVQSETWQRPAHFARRSWDANGLVGDDPLWGRFWEVESLTAEQRQTFTMCRDALRSELQLLPVTPEHYGLIHADLHPGNLLASGDQLTVIDFDDAGFGWFEHELAVALHPVLNEPWEPQARAALLQGYRDVHSLTARSEALIDTFVTVRCLMLVSWLEARPELRTPEFLDDLVSEAHAVATWYLARQ